MKVLASVLLLINIEFYYSISVTTIESLREIQHNLSKYYKEEGAEKWGLHTDGSYSYSLLKNMFLNNTFLKYIGEEPIFVYEAVSHNDSALGNRFGNFFEVISFF